MGEDSQVSRFVISNFVPAMLALLMVMVMVLSGEQLNRLWNGSRPAIEWQGVKVLTPTVRPGDILTLEYSAVINKQCPSDLRGFIIAEDGSAPVRFPIVTGGYSKPAHEPVKIKVNISIPRQADGGLASFQSGPHRYRTMVTRYCPDGVEEDDGVPDAPFMLEVP